MVLSSLVFVTSACSNARKLEPLQSVHLRWAVRNVKFLDAIDVFSDCNSPECRRIALRLSSGLTKKSSDSKNTIAANLARSWKWIDARTFVVDLRPDLLWSDGKPVRAQDVRWSWSRLRPSAVNNAVGTVFRHLQAKDLQLTATLERTLNATERDLFVAALSRPMFYVWRRQSFVPPYVSLGDYVPERVTRNEIVLRKQSVNVAGPDTLTYLAEPKESVRIRRFEQNEIDIADELSVEGAALVAHRQELRLRPGEEQLVIARTGGDDDEFSRLNSIWKQAALKTSYPMIETLPAPDSNSKSTESDRDALEFARARPIRQTSTVVEAEKVPTEFRDLVGAFSDALRAELAWRSSSLDPARPLRLALSVKRRGEAWPENAVAVFDLHRAALISARAAGVLGSLDGGLDPKWGG